MLRNVFSRISLVASLLASFVLAGTYSELMTGSDGTYFWRGYTQPSSAPSRNALKAIARDAYFEMVDEAVYMSIDPPSTMSAAYWPGRRGHRGLLVVHSSIKGGYDSEITRDYINSCSLGGHRYRGMCAEIANIVYAQEHGFTSGAAFAVYGIVNATSGETGFMSPCGHRGESGCRSYVEHVNGYCITKRDALPNALPEINGELVAEPMAEREAEPEPAKGKKGKSSSSKAHSSTKSQHTTQTHDATKSQHTTQTHDATKSHSSGASHVITTGTHSVVTGAACKMSQSLDPAESKSFPSTFTITADITGSSRQLPPRTSKSKKKNAARATSVALPRRHLAGLF